MKLKNVFIIAALVTAGVLPIACERIFPDAPADETLLDGPMEGLTHGEYQQFNRGDFLFNDLVFTPETGLGPIFVATSCGACHPGDGKGHPFTSFVRFGQNDHTGNKYLDQGAPQLQHRAIPGYEPEKLPEGAPHTTLIAPAVTGLGFLDLVSDEDLLAMAEANKSNEDGVRGRPNWINLPSYVKPRANAIQDDQGRYIGRFGFKGSVYDLLQQTVDALNQDIGITSIYNPIDPYSLLEVEPEIPATDIHDMVFYLKTLKAPIQRNADDPQVQEGKAIFAQIGCESCHKETLKTGQSSIAALSGKEFHPYTDLLLHDLGPEMDDGYTEGSAKTSEWRTAPLWGIGLAKDSQGGNMYLMHDGRAKNIDEAIMLHGGEGDYSRQNYSNLPEQEKQKLIRFLESL